MTQHYPKAAVILLTAAVTVLANAAFLVVLNTAYYRVVGCFEIKTLFMVSHLLVHLG